MKTKILLFSTVILLNLLVLGQSEQSNFILNNNIYEYQNAEFGYLLSENDEKLDLFIDQVINNQGPDDLWMLDSIVSYDFITEIDSFSFERQIYTYNNGNNTVENVVLQRNNLEEAWLYTSKNLLTFNDNNDQILSISYVWDEGQWVNEQKSESTYTGNSLLESRIRSYWNIDHWLKNDKISYAYNENDDETEQSNYDWIEDDQIWLHNFKVELGYNDQGLRNFVLLYSLNFETNELYARVKYETLYNDLGLLVQEIHYTRNFDIEDWEPLDKLISSYNNGLRSNDTYWWRDNDWQLNKQYEETRLDTLTIEGNGYSLRDDTLWVHTSNSTLGYDAMGRIISQESYRFEQSWNYWLGTYKFDRLYNDNGQTFAVIYYDWDVVLDKWDYKTTNETGYDENQLRSYYTTKQWNLEESIWETEISEKYYYTNISSVNENENEYSNIKVYPNPCNNQLSLDIDYSNSSETIYRINSILGGIIIEGRISKINKTINVSQLEKGFYLIQVVNGKEKYSGKFVKL